MRSIKTVGELWDFVGYVVLYAPDEFPIEDYLAPEDQMTLDRAFRLLSDGIVIAYPEDASEDRRQWLTGSLDRAFTAYRQGDLRGGAQILHDDFQGAIFKA